MKDLVKILKKAPTFEAFCDAADLSPKKAKAALESLRKKGAAIRFEDGVIGIGIKPSSKVTKLAVKPVLGRHSLAVISDTHLGSKFCLKPQLRDFLEGIVRQGQKIVLHPGDVLEGLDTHKGFGNSSYDLEGQVDELYELTHDLPLTFYFITGNHDSRFEKAAGIDVGRAISQRFNASKARWVCVGQRRAYVKAGSAMIELWHPGGSGGANVTTPLRNRVVSYAPGQKPDVLLVGHYHKEAYVRIRGVHAIACPTFQGPGGDFGNSLSGDPAMGATILHWTETDTGIRSFMPEFISYYPAEPKRFHDLVAA